VHTTVVAEPVVRPKSQERATHPVARSRFGGQRSPWTKAPGQINATRQHGNNWRSNSITSPLPKTTGVHASLDQLP